MSEESGAASRGGMITAREWVARHERKDPVYPKTEDEFLDDIMFHELDEDELERIERWRVATIEERGQALYDLLDLVDKTGHFPPKRDMFPGFPNHMVNQCDS